MNILRRIFFSRIKGYICSREEVENDFNKVILDEANVKYLTINIPFFSDETHWTKYYFIPRDIQENLTFLTLLKRLYPIEGYFKGYKLVGFSKLKYKNLSIFCENNFKEIELEHIEDSLEENALQMEKYYAQAEKSRIKYEEKQAKKAEEKERKKAEREKLKTEREMAKKAEKEKLKAEKQAAKNKQKQ